MRARAALPLALALPVALGAAGPAPAPEPEQGAYVVLERVSGDVEAHPANRTRYRDVSGPARRYPVGVTVDAQEGAVRLTIAGEDGRTSSAVFSEGKFTVLQARDEATATLRLTGPSYADVCGDAVASTRRTRRVRRLWGDGRGSFRTAGRYSAATVRGTRWLTEDRCDGTVTRVVRGAVEVDDFNAAPPAPGTEPAPSAPEEGGVRPVTDGGDGDVIVSAGGRYVARP